MLQYKHSHTQYSVLTCLILSTGRNIWNCQGWNSTDAVSIATKSSARNICYRQCCNMHTQYWIEYWSITGRNVWYRQYCNTCTHLLSNVISDAEPPKIGRKIWYRQCWSVHSVLDYWVEERSATVSAGKCTQYWFTEWKEDLIPAVSTVISPTSVISTLCLAVSSNLSAPRRRPMHRSKQISTDSERIIVPWPNRHFFRWSLVFLTASCSPLSQLIRKGAT